MFIFRFPVFWELIVILLAQSTRLETFTVPAKTIKYGSSSPATILLVQHLECRFLTLQTTAKANKKAAKGEAAGRASKGQGYQPSTMVKQLDLGKLRPLWRQKRFRTSLESVAKTSFVTHPQIRRLLDNESDVGFVQVSLHVDAHDKADSVFPQRCFSRQYRQPAP